MKFITRFLCVPVAGLLALTSCAKDEDESYVQFENQALEAWMTQHRPDLVKNYQPDGGYYIDVLDAHRRYFDAQINYSNAVRDRYLAIANLYRALGGGF